MALLCGLLDLIDMLEQSFIGFVGHEAPVPGVKGHGLEYDRLVPCIVTGVHRLFECGVFVGWVSIHSRNFALNASYSSWPIILLIEFLQFDLQLLGKLFFRRQIELVFTC